MHGVYCYCGETRKVHALSKSLLNDMVGGKDWVSRGSLRSFAGVATSIQLALPLMLFYTRSIHDVLNDWSEVKNPAASGAERVRLSRENGHRAKKGLKEWA